MVLVREPTTKTGMWPLVALGPVTIRAYVKPPEPAKTRKKQRKLDEDDPEPSAAWANDPFPTVEWFLSAAEQLGDAAIAGLDLGRGAISRVEELVMRLQAFPEHEKLHQALMTTCEEAAKLPEKERRARQVSPLDELGEEDEAEEGEVEEEMA
jgi:hypothetical protein